MCYIKKNIDWIILNFPALIILVLLIIEPTLHKTMRAWTGYTAFSLLVLVLAMNPLRSLLKSSAFLNKVNRYRRIIGVAVFTYSVIHMLCYIIKKGGIYGMMKHILHPVIITGFAGFIIFILLAVTSNNYSVKKMGYDKWKQLHQKVYIAEYAVMIHMILMGGTPRVVGITVFIPLIIVQYIRRVRKKRLQ